VAGAIVGFGGHDSAGFQTTTGADGRFTLSPIEGTYPSDHYAVGADLEP